MVDEKDSFIERAQEVYMRFGIKSVTMDDMARQLRVSKKTIYKYVEDKKDLVCQAMQCLLKKERVQIKEILDNAENAIDANLQISRMVADKLRGIQPGVFYDLEKYHPKAMGIFEEHKSNFMYNTMKQNLEEGIAQGLYRSDMNVEVVALIHVHTIHSFFQQMSDLANDSISPLELHQQLFSYQIHAVVSEKGLKYLNERMKDE